MYQVSAFFFNFNINLEIDYFHCNETLSCKSTEGVIRVLILRIVRVHLV